MGQPKTKTGPGRGSGEEGVNDPEGWPHRNQAEAAKKFETEKESNLGRIGDTEAPVSENSAKRETPGGIHQREKETKAPGESELKQRDRTVKPQTEKHERWQNKTSEAH